MCENRCAVLWGAEAGWGRSTPAAPLLFRLPTSHMQVASMRADTVEALLAAMPQHMEAPAVLGYFEGAVGIEVHAPPHPKNIVEHVNSNALSCFEFIAGHPISCTSRRQIISVTVGARARIQVTLRDRMVRLPHKVRPTIGGPWGWMGASWFGPLPPPPPKPLLTHTYIHTHPPTHTHAAPTAAHAASDCFSLRAALR